MVRTLGACLGGAALVAGMGLWGVTGAASAPSPHNVGVGGYRLVAGDGGVFSFAAPFFGSGATSSSACDVPATVAPNFPGGVCWSMATTPTGDGYWILDGYTGVITPYGDAQSYGTPAAQFAGVGREFTPRFLQVVATPDGKGYWVLDEGLSGLGGVEHYGSAGSFGDENTQAAGGEGHVGSPVGMASTATGKGYWIADSDGGVFSFGDAVYYGSMGGKPLNAPVVGIAATPDGGGYWLVAADGGVFSFGDAVYYGSMGAKPLNAPVVGIAPDLAPGSAGYWLVASDGGVFAFGHATFLGSMGGRRLNAPVFAISASPAA